MKRTPILKITALLALLACGASAQAQTGFVENFGTAAGRVSNTNVTFTFAGTGPVANNYYTIMPPDNITGSTGEAYWVDLDDDHTGGGALMVVNAGTSVGAAGTFYARDFDVKAGRKYRVAGWRYVVNGDGGAGSTNPLAWQFTVSGAEGLAVNSGPINTQVTQAWDESTWEFTVPQICATKGKTMTAHLDVSNQTAQDGGNDLYVDDISVTDIGPAPDPCPAPAAVPALDAGGLGLLGLLSAGLGGWALRRRKQRA